MDGLIRKKETVVEKCGVYQFSETAVHYQMPQQFFVLMEGLFFDSCLLFFFQSHVNGEPFDIFPYIGRCALDVICGEFTMICMCCSCIEMLHHRGNPMKLQTRSISSLEEY